MPPTRSPSPSATSTVRPSPPRWPGAGRIRVARRERAGPRGGDPAEREILGRRGGGHPPRAFAGEGLLELGSAPAEADELLRDADGESPEELIAAALKLARSAG